MKGQARLITGSIGAKARMIEGLTAQAHAIGRLVGAGWPTDGIGLHHFLHVAPEQPQELVWLVPQVGIDYTITTSTNLKWQIK